LGADGEDTEGIIALPQYLVLATVLLLSPRGNLPPPPTRQQTGIRHIAIYVMVDSETWEST